MAYESKIKSPEVDAFFEAVLSMKTVEECYRLFDDVATYAEVQSMAQRWQVARMLADNETYTEIVEATGASTATISRVKKSLTYGADGYTLALKRTRE